MKNLLLFIFCLLSFAIALHAQVPTAMPPDANDFYNTSMPLLRPQVKNIVLQTAKALKSHKANADSLFKSIKTNNALKEMSSKDIDGIVVLIIVQASKDADADLKNMVMGISHTSEKKAETRSTNQTAIEKNNRPKAEVNETQNLQLQTIMNHKSNMAEEVTYVMKRISGSQNDIINNLK